jgi:membrane protein DedA with SNARE-associated domain
MHHSRTNLTILAFAFASLGLLGLLMSFDSVQDFLVSGISFLAVSFWSFIESILILTIRGVTITVSTLGYPGIFVLMFLENMSLPIPSEVTLPFSGYLASVGRFEVWIVILISTIAGIGGSVVDYYIGGIIGKIGRSSSFLDRPVVKNTLQLDRAQRWFDQHGAKAVFFTRLIPGVRTIISFPAGAAKMNMAKYIIYTTLGCFLWSAALVYTGLYLGIHWYEFLGLFHYLTIAAVVSVILAIALWFLTGNFNSLHKEQTTVHEQ